MSRSGEGLKPEHLSGTIVVTAVQLYAMPSKNVQVREYKVRAHERVIHSRRYNFVCAECNQAVERESYGPKPLYCEFCRPTVSHTELAPKKKRPKPVLVKKADAPQDDGIRAARQ